MLWRGIMSFRASSAHARQPAEADRITIHRGVAIDREDLTLSSPSGAGNASGSMISAFDAHHGLMLSDGDSEQVRPSDAKCIAIISIAAIMCVLVERACKPRERRHGSRTGRGDAKCFIDLWSDGSGRDSPVSCEWFHFKRVNQRLLLPLLMLSAAALMVVNVVVPTHAMSWGLLSDIVRSPQSMSYFCDAGVLRSFPGWLGQYDQVMSKLSMHSQTKPPGPILYFTFFIDVMGYTRAAAVVSGLVIGLIATFSIPATYWLVKRFSGNRDAAFFASSFLAMCPGFILIFPLFDGCYILFAVAPSFCGTML